MPQTYQVNEIFYTLQGEGRYSGRPAVFLRFSGCNLTCSMETHGFDCDTEFASGRKMTAAEIVEEMKSVLPEGVKITSSDPMLLVVTGGEPLLQFKGEILKELDDRLEWFIAIETNGTLKLTEEQASVISYATCSPKVAEHAVKFEFGLHEGELRYVRSKGQGIPRPSMETGYRVNRYISPAFLGDQPDPEAVAWCIELVKENPTWNLSLQTHKLINIR